MRIRIISSQFEGNIDRGARELDAYVAGELFVAEYDQGQLEDMAHTLDKIRESFGRLVEKLVERGHLSLEDDVAGIVDTGDKLMSAPREEPGRDA